MENQPGRPPQAQRKRGRPPKTSGEPKRSSFNTRIRSELKTRLEREAEKTGRSLSEEIEHRLEGSFLEEDARYAGFGGKGGYDLFHLIGSAAKLIGEQAEKNRWWRDPETYDAIAEILPGLLKAFRPKGHRAKAASSTLTGLTMDIQMEITKPTKAGPQIERRTIQLGGSHLDKIEL